MSKIIKNKIITILGIPGTGKTFFSMFLQSFYSRVYSNVDFFYKGKKVNKKIKSIESIELIDYNEVKGFVVLDESGININSRRSMSDKNLEFAKLGMLGRKKNVDICIIGQLERSIDVYFKELSEALFIMHSYFIGKDYLLFEAEVKNRYGDYLTTIGLDLIKFANWQNRSYDTKEQSLIN